MSPPQALAHFLRDSTIWSTLRGLDDKVVAMELVQIPKEQHPQTVDGQPYKMPCRRIWIFCFLTESLQGKSEYRVDHSGRALL